MFPLPPQLPLTAILDAVADGITVQDETGKIVYVNTTAAAIMGYATPQEALSASPEGVLQRFELMDEYGAPFPLDRLPGRLAFQGLGNASAILRFRVRATGAEHWSMLHAQVVEGDGRRFVVHTFHDITEQKRAEERLRASEESYRELVESANDIIYTLDLQGNLTSINRVGEQLLGYSLEEMLNRPVVQLAAPEDKAMAEDMIHRKVTHHERTHYEVNIRTKDGRTVTFDMNSRPVMRDGKPIGIYGIGRDITARKRVETHQRFLAQASSRLTGSLDYETTLTNVARLMTPTIADWSAIDVLTEGNTIQRVAVSHVNPDKIKWAYEIQQRYPVDLNAPRGVPLVLRTGQSEFYPQLSEAMLEASARDDQHLQIIREIGFRSAIIVPLVTSGGTLGAMTLVTTLESGREFDSLDVLFAEELGRIAGLAVQNARLYQAAQLEQERLRVTLASIGDAVIATDDTGCVTFMNSVAEQLMGLTQQEASGQPLPQVFSIVNEYTREVVENPVQKVFETGVIVGLANHTVLIARDGREVPIEDSAAPIRDTDGNIVGAVLVFRDVTEERRAETELQQARAEAEAARLNLQNLFMEAPALIGIMRGPEGRVELFNPHFMKLWNYRDVMGKPFREAFHELEGQGWFEIREQVYRTGQSIVGTEREARFDRNGDGQWEQMFFNFVYQATHDANGVVDGVAIYGVEVTDQVLARRRAEAIAHELRTTQERLQLLMDSAKDYAIFAVDMNGRITNWNAGAERVFGYAESEILGQGFSITFTPEDRDTGIPEQELGKAVEVGYAEDERWHLRKDMTRFYASGVVRPVRDALGKLQGFIKVARDTTTQKLATQRMQLLQRLASELAGQLKMQDMVDSIIHSSLDAVDATMMSVFLFRPQEQILERFISEGFTYADQQSYLLLPLNDRFPVTDAARTREILWVSNQQEYISRYPHLQEVVVRNQIHAALCLPLVVETRLLGALSLSFTYPKVLSTEDWELVRAVAHLAAQAFERARLYEQAQAIATLRERHRLARDLHDAVNQTLFSAMIMAESLPRLWQRDPERVFPLLQQVHTLNKAAAAEMRVLLWELRPETLEKTPLQDLYTQLVQAIRGRKLIEVSLDLQIQVPLNLPLPVHIAFYRVAQEAINNVVKHAQARHFTLVLLSLPDRVELAIIDDGIGFENILASGIGMASMNERAEEIRAVLTVTSAVNEGTQVLLTWYRP